MAQARATTSGEVLTAAARVFCDRGFKTATLDDIAAEAGVSKPTLYRYSKGKQWLLDEISRTARATLSQRAAAQAHLSGIDHLRATILVTAQSTVDLRVLYQAYTINALELSALEAREHRAWMKQVTARTADTLKQCRAEGSLHLPGDITVYANLLQSMLRGIFSWYDPAGPVSPEQLAEQMIDLVAQDRRS